LFWLGVVGILSPFLLLVFFAQPAADDFCIAASAKQGFFAAQADWYTNWTGRFSMVAVTTALASFGELQSVYWVGSLIFLAGTVVAAWCVIDRFAGPALSAASKVLAALGTLALFATEIPSPVQAFYWHSGAVTYHTGLIAFICFLAWMPWISDSTPEVGKLARICALCLLAAFAVGSNETLMLLVTGCVFAAVGLNFMLNKALLRVSTPVLVVIAIADAIVILAPGNSVRGVRFAEKHDFFGALTHAATQAVDFGLTWTGSLSLWAASVLIFFTLPSVIEQRGYLAYPQSRFQVARWLIPIAGTGAIITMFFVTWYVTGHAPTYRTVNSIYGVFLLTWFGTLTAAVCYATKSSARNDPGSVSLLWLAKAALLIGLVNSGNFHDAVRSLLMAPRYVSEWNDRYNQVRMARQNNQRHLIVAPINTLPKTIFFEDLTSDPGDWRNLCFAEYMGLPAASVRVGQP
jgi:hypothetical protein